MVKGWSLLKRRVVVARVLQVGKQLRVLRLADEGQGTRGGWARIHGRPRAQRWRRARAAVHVLVPVLDSAQESFAIIPLPPHSAVEVVRAPDRLSQCAVMS